jgi:quercetin dioxygenase-like cupin family protein
VVVPLLDDHAAIIDAMSIQLIHFDEIPSFSMAPGVGAKALFGERSMFNLVELAPGSSVAPHSHPHEQLGVILAGLLALTVEGETHELGPMDAYALPGDVEHSATCGPDGATVLDVFTPVREDYRARASAG